MATQLQHKDDLTEAEQRIRRLRRMLEELKAAIRDAEEMLKKAERSP